MKIIFLFLAIMIHLLAVSTTSAQCNNRYTQLDDFGHHTYLEQHELPVLGHGPTDPADIPNKPS